MGTMSCTTTFIVAALYVVACVVALVGIATTASVYFKDNSDGTLTIENRLTIGCRLPEGPWGAAGPILIASSVILGMCGNLIWLLSG
jgi:hypothetical protein